VARDQDLIDRINVVACRNNRDILCMENRYGVKIIVVAISRLTVTNALGHLSSGPVGHF
jgi:hypothetical protein